MQRKKPGPAPLAGQVVDKIRVLLSDGLSITMVSRLMGLHTRTVRRYSGTEPPVAGRPLTWDEKTRIHDLFDKGWNVRRISMLIKRGPETVARELDRADLRRIGPHNRFGPAEKEHLAWAHGRGQTQAGIARHLERGVGTIRWHARKLGLEFRRGAPMKRSKAPGWGIPQRKEAA